MSATPLCIVQKSTLTVAAIAGARKVLDYTDVIFMEWSKHEGYVQMFDQLQSHGFQASCNRAASNADGILVAAGGVVGGS